MRNTVLPGTGETYASDIDTVKNSDNEAIEVNYQKVKLVVGEGSIFRDVTQSFPFPVSVKKFDEAVDLLRVIAVHLEALTGERPKPSDYLERGH